MFAWLQVIHQLKQLGTVWQDVLPVSIYCKAMGNLLNTAISEVIAKIMMLEVCLLCSVNKWTNDSAHRCRDVNVETVKMCSGWKQWTPQDDIQSQCKDAIFTLGDKNLVIQAMWITANQLWDSPDVTDVLTAQTFPEFAERTFNQTWPSKNNCCCVWKLLSSCNTTLYTTGLCYEHRHDVNKLSNDSSTSTTDMV